MAVTLSPPSPPTSLKRVNSDGTPTQAQLDYERAIAKWVSDQIGAISGGVPFPTPTTLGGVKSFAAVSHKFLTSIGTDGLPVAAQPVAGDISGLGSLATANTVAVGSVTGLGALATLSAIDLATQATGNLGVSHFNSGIDASSSKFWRGDGTWAPVTASPGGSGGQVQFNNAGSLSGFTLGGDGTLDVTTGNLTVTKTNGVALGSLATLNSVSASNFTAQTARFVLAGPVSGSAATPTFRQLSSNDLTDGTTGTGNVVLSDAPTLTGLAHGGSLTLSSTLTAATANATNITGTAVSGTVGSFDSLSVTTATIATLTVDTPSSGTSPGTIASFKDVDNVTTRVLIDSVGAAANVALDLRRARGTSAALSAVQLDDFLGTVTARGYGATAYSSTASTIIGFYAAENWSDTAQGSYLSFETTPNGSATSSRAKRLRVENDGKVGVGRTATTYLLEVAGDIFSTGAFRGSGANLTGITSGQVSGLATVATSGLASDLTGTLAAARLPAFGSGDVSFATAGGAGTIANDAVTYAKMQNVSATSRFIGRKTAGAGDPEELSAADVKTILAYAFSDLSGSVAASQLPNPAASTLGGVKSLAAVAHKFLTSIGTDGLPVAAQPVVGDVTGAAASGANSDITALSGLTTSNWIPALKFGGNATGMTYTTQTGKYMQLGKFGIAAFLITLSAKGSSTGGATITGVPFSSDATLAGTCQILFYSGMSGMSAPVCYLSVSTVTLNLAGATGLTAIADTNFTNTTTLYGVIITLTA